LLFGGGAGVLAIAGLALGMGFGAQARILDAEAAVAALRAHEAGAAAVEVSVDRKGRAALMHLADGRFAAVRAVADALAVRVFAASGVAAVSLGRPNGRPFMRIDLLDVGFPRLTLELDKGEVPAWVERLRHQTRSACMR
jgi:hypothetical protein